jgi:hypothetical protein
LRTETITTTGDVVIAGTLTVTGSNIVASVETVEAKDPLISLAKDNSADTFDIGFYGKSVTGGDAKYHGIVRDADDSGKFKVFKDASGEPTTIANTDTPATLVADLEVPAGSELNLPMSNGTLADYVTAITLGTAKANKVLTVDESKNLTGINNITALGTIQAGNVLISGSNISTSSGAAPSFEEVAVTGGSIDGVTIGGTTPGAITATTLTVNGNTTLGDATTDTLTITAKVNSNVIPTGTVTLGTLSAKWAEAHVGTMNTTALSATGNIDLGTDENNTLTVNAFVDSDIVPDADGTHSLGSTSNRWAHVHADNVTANSLTPERVVFAGENGKLVDDSNLTFSGATLTATNLSVTTSLSADAFNSSSVDINGGSIDGVNINTSDITVGSGKTLDVSLGTLTTSNAQNLYILQNAGSNIDFGDYTLTATTFVGEISSLSTHDTDDLSEGSTNLYYTNERVDDRVGSLLTEGQAIGLAYTDNDSAGTEGAGSLEISVDTATATNLGVASFTLSDFQVNSGEVSIKTGGVSNEQLAGSIANNKLSNYEIDIAGQTVALGGEITAASIAAAIDGESMAITNLTDLDGEAGSLTIFDTLTGSGGTLTIGSVAGVVATPADLNITGTMLQNVDLANGKEYRIENGSGTAISVLTATTLGSGVVNSSLTSVGVLASGNIASGFGSISTQSNISTTQVLDLASDADADDYSADSATGRLTLGASDDLNLYHSGSHSYVVNKVGELRLDVPSLSEISLSVAGTEEAHIDADGLDLASGNDYRIAGSSVLSANTLGSGVVASSLTSVSALDSGSITENFGSINVGASSISTSGSLSAGNLSVDNLRFDGVTIGHADHTDLMTLSSGTLSIDGRVALTTLKIGSDDVTATADEINILDGDTAATSTTIIDADRLILNDNGNMVQVAVTDLAAYLDDEITSMPNLVSAVSLATLGTITTGAWEATDVAVLHGGTGASDAETARENLGLKIGSHVQSWADDLDTLSAMQSGAALVAATLTAAEFGYLNKDEAIGVAEASKALILDNDSSITSGLSTLTASTFTTGSGASLNGANLTANNVIASAIYPSSGNLTLSAVGSSNVTVSVDLNCEGKIIGGDSGVEFQGSMTLDTDDHVIVTTSNKTLPTPAAGREMIYINNSDSQITLTVFNATLHDIYSNGSAVDSVNIGARNTLRLIAANSSLWYVV